MDALLILALLTLILLAILYPWFVKGLFRGVFLGAFRVMAALLLAGIICNLH